MPIVDLSKPEGDPDRIREETPEELAVIELNKANLLQTVPDEVSPLQMRRALRLIGIRPSVEAYLDQLRQAAENGDESAEDSIEAWEYATTIRRDNALIATAAAGLGLTEEQLDELFRIAQSLG
jgi:hypothetical protein